MHAELVKRIVAQCEAYVAEERAPLPDIGKEQLVFCILELERERKRVATPDSAEAPP